MTWPWPEIPEPTFGLTEMPGTPTQDRAASTTGNITLQAGAVLRLLPGSHHISGRTWTLNGTPNAPVFIVCEPGANIVDSAQLTVTGSYYVLRGLSFQGGARIRNTGSFCGIRECEITGLPWTTSSRVMVSCEGGSDVVVAYNHIHDNSPRNASGEGGDTHACKASALGFERLWYLGNECHGNGGDSIQIGSAVLSEPWPRYIYIAGNEMCAEGENGIDLKKSRDVIAVENEIWGMTATAGNDPGRGIVIHDDADHSQIIRNYIRDNEGEGIVSTGADNLVIRDNEIRNSKFGVRAYSSSGEAYGNKAWDCETAFQFNVPSGTVDHHDNLEDPPEGGGPPSPFTSISIAVEA